MRALKYVDIYKTDKLCYNIAIMSSKYDSYMKRFSIPNNNKEGFFLSILIIFSILTRVLPFTIITILSIAVFAAIVGIDFYFFINKKAKDENKNEKTTEFSWGFVKEKKDLMDFQSVLKYLKHKEFAFYKEYLLLNINKIIILTFVFGDLFVAFKNLDFFNSGIYIAMSIFSKFVFLGYIFMRQSYAKLAAIDKVTEENVLDVFYTQISSMLSVFAAIFIFFFVLSKYMIDIFFGNSYAPYQTSLPFVLLANMSLVVAICVYTASKKVDQRVTDKITKVFAIIFSILFVFMSINYLDTITYFIIGSSALLSIFLYNFVIKKPEYIRSTYNLLF
jgi:hypothetical protein